MNNKLSVSPTITMSLVFLSLAYPVKSFAQDAMKSKSVNTSVVSQKQLTTINTGNKHIKSKSVLLSGAANQMSIDGISDEMERKQIEKKLFGGSSNELEVLYDSGNTVSIDNYYLSNPEAKRQEVKRFEQAREQVKEGIKQPQQKHVEQIMKGHFPISPDVISFSSVSKKQVLRDIPQLEHNIFVVGDDKYSLQWIEYNKEELLRFGAVGILTKVDSMVRFKEILEQVKPLSLMPVSADFVQKEFGVTNYPVLITNKGEFR